MHERPAAEKLAPRQAKILAALAKARGPMAKAGVVAKSGVNPNWIAEMLGTGKEGCSDRVSGKGPLKLVPAGFAKVVFVPMDGTDAKERCWEITPRGRKALERWEREQAEAKPAKPRAAKAKAHEAPAPKARKPRAAKAQAEPQAAAS